MLKCPARWAPAAVLLVVVAAAPGAGRSAPAARGGLLLEGTVVTMDDAHQVVPRGHVLIRDGRIVAVWSRHPPRGIGLTGVRRISVGPRGLIFPGLIDLHDHPGYSVLPPWPPPSSDKQPLDGRPSGTEPYDNRYEWSGGTGPPEENRLIRNAKTALANPGDLGLAAQLVVYAEAEAALGGETALQGEDPTRGDGLVVRNVGGTNFGRDRIDSRIESVADPAGPWGDDRFTTSAALSSAIASHQVDAWIVHLAEGVRDSDRHPGDTFSSRGEFQTLEDLNLLTNAAVIVHGVGLEPPDFAAMKQADAKLVWSPLSNLLLYGRTANVYDALAAGVTVSLGTDWTPSGSKTLLDELKVADVALRDTRILGASRAEVPSLASQKALDRELVDMVTRNPARMLRWPEVGSVSRGKVADLLLISQPGHSPTGGMPSSPYRSLIDSTQRDVRLVLVGGRPVAGDLRLLHEAGARSLTPVHSSTGRFMKAVAFRHSAPKALRLSRVEESLRLAVRALGGDGAKRASGPPPPGRGFAYLKERWSHGQDKSLSAAAFHQVLATDFGTVAGRINLERIELSLLFTADDHFFFTMIEGRRTSTGVPADRSPPFELYPSNVNQGAALAGFQHRWYR